MKLCWSDANCKDSRPTFLELKEEFDGLITEEERHNYLSLFIEMADGEESAPQPTTCDDVGLNGYFLEHSRSKDRFQ